MFFFDSGVYPARFQGTRVLYFSRKNVSQHLAA